jgi:hypothetical protein
MSSTENFSCLIVLPDVRGFISTTSGCFDLAISLHGRQFPQGAPGLPRQHMDLAKSIAKEPFPIEGGPAKR